jgi:hypothetical protein
VTSFSRATVALGLTLLACGPASAQFRPERPYRGIFANGVDGAGQSLTAQATISGGYDDNILADATRRNTAIRDAKGGGLGQFSGGLSYALSGDRASLNAGAGTSIRYYPSLPNDYYKTYNGSLGGQVILLRKPQWTAHAQASYRPFSFLSLTPQDEDIVDPTIGASAPPEVDFVPVATQYFYYSAGSNLSQRLSRRTTLDLNYGYSTADRLDRHFWRQGAGATVRYQMTKDLSFRTGYKYTEAHYGDRTTHVHRPDVGLDFLHALSLTRRTTFSFGVGTEATVINDQTRIRATGNANIAHEMGRTWTLAGSYRRGTYYTETLPEPVFGDAASASLTGLITRRLQFQAAATASLGSVGSGARRKYDIYRGTVSLSTALTRFMNMGLDYAYFEYSFNEDIVLDAGVPRDINRQSIRAHLTLWAPLMNRARRN